MNSDLEIVTVTKTVLKKAVSEDLYWKNKKHVPFSKKKANWLLANDRMLDDDVCAILAYNKGELASFVIMIPDYIKIADKVKKVYWSIRWWVSDTFKESLLPSYIRTLSFQEINNQVLIRFAGKEVRHFYEKQPFSKFNHRTRYIFLFNIDADILIRKIKKLRVVYVPLQLLDRASYKFLTTVNKMAIRKSKSKLRYEYLDRIDNRAWQFIAEHCKDDVVPKSMNYINWQLSNNQYTIMEASGKSHIRYGLNSVSRHILNSSLFVRRNDVIIGFISVFIRTKEFAVRYFMYEPNHFNDCATAIMDIFLSSGCTLFQTEIEKLGAYVNQKLSKVHVDKEVLYSLAHKDLAYDFNDTILSEQDGNYL